MRRFVCSLVLLSNLLVPRAVWACCVTLCTGPISLPFISDKYGSTRAGEKVSYLGIGSQALTEREAAIAVPRNGTVKNLYCQVQAEAATSVAFSFRKNSADTAIACTAAGADASCEDTSHTATVARGDRITFRRNVTFVYGGTQQCCVDIDD